MKTGIVAFASGMLFAIGLCVSGMTQPSKVIGFLDVRGAWDPSLACVMVGAIGVYAVAARWAGSAARPLFASTFQLPTRSAIDAPLIAGAALFGIGWGLAGYCPGPAVASLTSFAPPTVAFLAAMLVGMVAASSLDGVVVKGRR
jgi:uncharacterized membrane protein YedE/YeeE